MPQKPQVRAKEKRRQTKRLEAWRAKQTTNEAGTPAAKAKKEPATKAAPAAAAKKAAKKTTA